MHHTQIVVKLINHIPPFILLMQNHSTHALKIYNQSKHMTNIQKPRNHRTNALLAQLLAQAEGSRSGERASRSGELLSPRQGLEKRNNGIVTHSRLGETSSPKRDVLSLKTRACRLSDSSRRQSGRDTANLA